MIRKDKIKSIEIQKTVSPQNETKELDWHNFIKRTYGSLANDPIIREPQGEFEIREVII